MPVLGQPGPSPHKATAVEVLDKFHTELYPMILDSIERNSATHFVYFVNPDMSSSQLGNSTGLCVGPDCTFKTPEDCRGKWLNDLPSQRQYPEIYCDAAELVALLHERLK